MYNYQVRFHVVGRGETLDSIAGKYHLNSRRELYGAPCNADFRRKRPKPELIQPGDRLGIPPDPRGILLSRLKMLQELRAKMGLHFNQLIRELDGDFQQMAGVKEDVDIAAMVAQVSLALATLIATGFKSVALSGQKLADFNNDLTKTWMSGRVQDATAMIGGKYQNYW